tara:strand:- start:1321 stop:1746 length:426 start_codon:yes stop_codon:yes gene_type:complete
MFLSSDITDDLLLFEPIKKWVDEFQNNQFDGLHKIIDQMLSDDNARVKKQSRKVVLYNDLSQRDSELLQEVMDLGLEAISQQPTTIPPEVSDEIKGHLPAELFPKIVPWIKQFVKSVHVAQLKDVQERVIEIKDILKPGTP